MFLNKCGGFSVSKNPKELLNSLNHAASFLRNLNNMVLIFPQGEIETKYRYPFNFERGIEVFLNRGSGQVQLVFITNIIDYFSNPSPDRPEGWIENGNALYYMPKIFGGSKEKAMESYNKAIQLMEKDSEMVKRNWMYLNVLMVLGQSYEKTGNFQFAKITCEKVLRTEPDFTYMREELLPSLLNKMGCSRLNGLFLSVVYPQKILFL